MAERAAWALALLAVLALAIQIQDGLSFLAFFDEATHVLGGQVLDRGGRLYSDFVDTHGPVIFLLSGAWGRVFGWSGGNLVRLTVAALALLCLGAVAASPRPGGRPATLCAVLLFAGLLACVWLRQALYQFSFYPVGGALAGIGLAGFVIPACLGRSPGPLLAVAAGLSLAMLAGVAYSFWPSIALFAAAAIWAGWSAQRRRLAGFLAGAAAGTALWLTALARTADLHGYLAFHLAENQFVYAAYIHFAPATFLRSLVPGTDPAWRAQTLGVLCVAGAALAVPRDRGRGPLALVLLGVLGLNARGVNTFQDGTFLWAAITALALLGGPALARLSPRAGVPAGAALVLATSWFLHGARYSPFGFDDATMRATPRWPIGTRSDDAFFRAIRADAAPGEGILALTYEPQLYLLADRLPMRGFYAWFPWDADYARAPWFGRPRDLCRALATRPPPVIVFDDAPMWDIPARRFMACVYPVLRDGYVLDTRFHDVHGALYVRRDRAARGAAGRAAG